MDEIDLGATPTAAEAAQQQADPMAILAQAFSTSTPTAGLDPVAPVAPTVETPAPVVEAPVLSADAQAAAALAGALRALPGIPPSLGRLITGATVADVQAAYATVQAGMTELAAAAVPPARGGGGAPPLPTDPFEQIKLGYLAQDRGRSA